MRQGEDSSKSKREPIGKVFNWLMVYSDPIVSRQTKLRTYLCLCVCGRFKEIIGANLRTGGTKSCGCKGAEIRRAVSMTHGMRQKREYRAWMGLKARCLCPTNKDYRHYGGRGITVCDRWKESFEAFYSDMGDKPTLRHSIDRIDVNGNYEPENCKWSTPKEQAMNKRPRSKKLPTTA